ncbi:MAG TPA: hypothetical protein DC000_02750, partial [Clostridiales bacterium]|nr:hypothetical protein [Clostridiales bacterium]
RMKQDKKELDELKAKIQTAGLEELENKNLKYIEAYGNDGAVVVSYKEKLEIDNFPILKDLVGEIALDKIKREESVKLTVDDKFKKALTAIYKKEFKQHDIASILISLGLDNKQINAATKKLKGDYVKDKNYLESLGVNCSNLEEELDAIKEQKNYELVSKFFDDAEKIDINQIKRAISVEETLGIGLNYEDN